MHNYRRALVLKIAIIVACRSGLQRAVVRRVPVSASLTHASQRSNSGSGAIA